MQLCLELSDVVACPDCGQQASRQIVHEQGCCYPCLMRQIDGK